MVRSVRHLAATGAGGGHKGPIAVAAAGDGRDWPAGTADGITAHSGGARVFSNRRHHPRRRTWRRLERPKSSQTAEFPTEMAATRGHETEIRKLATQNRPRGRCAGLAGGGAGRTQTHRRRPRTCGGKHNALATGSSPGMKRLAGKTASQLFALPMCSRCGGVSCSLFISAAPAQIEKKWRPGSAPAGDFEDPQRRLGWRRRGPDGPQPRPSPNAAYSVKGGGGWRVGGTRGPIRPRGLDYASRGPFPGPDRRIAET